MADDKIIIEFDGDIKALKAKLGTATKDVSNLEKASNGLKSSLGLAAKAGALGFAALTGAVAKSISLYKEQEQVQLKTVATIEATGKAAGLSSQEIFDMAASLQKVTTFGDEAIIAGQNLLLTFKEIGGDVFPRATEVMLDMSTALGQDLKSSAIQLGKALNDPVLGVSALSRVGIQFTGQQKTLIKSLADTGKTAEAQAIILAELEGQLGGTARAAAQGSGALTQTSNVLGDIGEEVGRSALPGLIVINKEFQKFLESLQGSASAKSSISDLFSNITKGAFFLQSIFNVVGAQIGNTLATISESLSSLFQGKFKQAATQVVEGYKNTNSIIIEEGIKLGERLAEVDKQYATDKSAREDQRIIDLKSRLAEQAEAEKAARQASFESQLEDLTVQKETLTQEELILEQNRLDQLAIQDEIEKAKQLQRDGKFNEAKNKLDEIQFKKDKKLFDERLKTEQAFANARVSILQSTANLVSAIAGSESKEAFLIGKAAAIAQSIVSTQVAAANALASVPYPANIAAAAQMELAGNLNTVAIAATAIKGFADGGMYTGGIAGVDSLPAMLQQGELVVPKKNFEEVVNSVAQSRDGGTNGGVMEVIIGFKDDAFELIEEKILERREIGIGNI